MTDCDFIEGLYKENRKRIRQLVKINIISFSSEDIDDCVEDVFLVAVNNIDKIKNHPNVPAWLSTTAKNVTMNFNRKYLNNTKKYPLCNIEAPVDEYVINKIETEKLKKSEAIMELMTSLSDEYKKIYFLRYIQNLSYDEIGNMLDMPSNTIGTKILRLNRILREKIKKL